MPFTAQDYPCWRGALSNGAALDAGLDLVENPGQAKLVWKSEAQVPKKGWTNRHQGGISSGFSLPVVCDGRVFLFYYEPAGTVVDEGYVAACKGKSSEPYARTKFLVSANDIVLCLDAKTGKTLWKHSFEGFGVNFNHSAQGPLALPFATAERVYVIGTGGLAYALEAKSGKPVWSMPLGPAGEWLLEKKKELLKTGKMFSNYSQATAFDGCPTLAAGVMVCSDNDFRIFGGGGKGPQKDCGFGVIGLDGETGKLLWGPIADASNYIQSPVRVQIENGEYVLTASYNRLLLIEPRTGGVLWQVNDVFFQGGTIAVAGDRAVLYSKKKPAHRATTEGFLRCYQFDAKSAKVAWEVPAGSYPKMYGHPTPLIYRGHVFTWLCRGTPKDESGTQECQLKCLSLSDGKVVADLGGGYGFSMAVASEGHVFLGGSYRARLVNNKWEACQGMRGIPTFAEAPTPAVAAGRAYTRSNDGYLYCYDFTR